MTWVLGLKAVCLVVAGHTGLMLALRRSYGNAISPERALVFVISAVGFCLLQGWLR